MTRDDADHEEGDVDPEPVPESDPQHIDPAGDLADAVESGDLDLSLTDDQDAEEIRAFVEAAESGELGPIDPGLEPQVRIARALFNDLDESDDAGVAENLDHLSGAPYSCAAMSAVSGIILLRGVQSSETGSPNRSKAIGRILRTWGH